MTDVDIRFYLSLLWRRLPYLVMIVASLGAVGIAIACFLPPVYRASAKILVEAPQIPADLARSTVPADPWQQIQIVEQRLTTRENLLDFARQLNVYGDSAATLSEDDIADDMRSRTTFEQLNVDPPAMGQGASMFAVSFDASDPEMAARVANRLVSVILNKNVSLRTDRASDTMQFFTRETSRLGNELSAIESQILKFKNANQGALPESADFRRTQQSNQQERLLLLDREEATLRSRRNNLMRSFEATGRVASSGPPSPEQQTLDDLNRTLATQLVIFAPDSPSIIALRNRIAALKESITARQASNPDASGPSEMDLQLSDVDDRLKAIADERQSIARNLDELEKSLAATPTNETVLASLERNRQNIQAQYNLAVAKMAEASTGEQIEADSKGSRMSVVEPASPPSKPIRPHRLRIAAMGIGAGIAAALGLMVLLELLNTRIRRPKELVALLQAQPLGTIPYIPAAAGTPGRRFGAATASTAILSVILVLALFSRRLAPLDMLIGKIAGIFGDGRAA